MRFLKLQSHFQACAAHSSFFNCSIKKKKKIKEIVTTTDQKQVLVVILYLPYSKNNAVSQMKSVFSFYLCTSNQTATIR